MTENNPLEEGPPQKVGPRTITLTLPSWAGLGLAFLSVVLVLATILGGVLGYRSWQHRQNLASARHEIADFFHNEQTKASTLLQVAGQNATQLQQDLNGGLGATKSSAIPLQDYADRLELMSRDAGSVQKVLSGLGDKEHSVSNRYHLAPGDTLFSADNQEQFKSLQHQLEDLNKVEAGLESSLQALAAQKDNLMVAEKKAAATAAARKTAQAQAKARQQRLYQPATVFGAPAYPVYGGGYYPAPAYYGGYYGGNGGYYRRPYWGGYGPGWGGPSIGVGFVFH